MMRRPPPQDTMKDLSGHIAGTGKLVAKDQHSLQHSDATEDDQRLDAYTVEMVPCQLPLQSGLNNNLHNNFTIPPVLTSKHNKSGMPLFPFLRGFTRKDRPVKVPSRSTLDLASTVGSNQDEEEFASGLAEVSEEEYDDEPSLNVETPPHRRSLVDVSPPPGFPLHGIFPLSLHGQGDSQDASSTEPSPDSSPSDKPSSDTKSNDDLTALSTDDSGIALSHAIRKLQEVEYALRVEKESKKRAKLALVNEKRKRMKVERKLAAIQVKLAVEEKLGNLEEVPEVDDANVFAGVMVTFGDVLNLLSAPFTPRRTTPSSGTPLQSSEAHLNTQPKVPGPSQVAEEDAVRG